MIIEFPFRKDRATSSLHSPPPPPSPAQSHLQSMTRTTNSSNPTTPTTPTSAKHDYRNPTVYYVCRDFFAAKPEHLSVFIDDELEILEEMEGATWTRVRERDSQQIGLIPTELLESGAERLAKENKTTNQDTIRIMSCQSLPSSSGKRRRSSSSNSGKVVSFCENEPEILQYPRDTTNDSSIFPFSLDSEEEKQVIEGPVIDDAMDIEVEMFQEITPPEHQQKQKEGGFFARLFKKTTDLQEKVESKQILKSLHSFQEYPDHLIRVYTGNFDQILGGFKTFIVDESLTFGEFSSMVLGTFGVDSDGFRYELNLVNHLTAEIIPVDLNYTIEQVIELTKRTGLAFSNRMPTELRKAQKSALSRLKKRDETTRDKASDYVTPFKFVLNRIYTQNDSIPLFVHVNLSASSAEINDGQAGPANLIISSLFNDELTRGEADSKAKKWYQLPLFRGTRSKKKLNNAAFSSMQHLKRIPVQSTDHIHSVVHDLLEILRVPDTLPGIAFEAFLPPIHDAIELPLPMNMPIGEALKIRPRIDQAQQVILVHPVSVNVSVSNNTS